MIDFTSSITYLENNRRIYAETDIDIYGQLSDHAGLKCSLVHWQGIMAEGRAFRNQNPDIDPEQYKESGNKRQLSLRNAYLSLLVDTRKAQHLAPLKLRLYEMGLTSKKPQEIATALEHLGGSLKNSKQSINISGGLKLDNELSPDEIAKLIKQDPELLDLILNSDNADSE